MLDDNNCETMNICTIYSFVSAGLHYQQGL